MDELHKQRDELNNELHTLPNERDNALREEQMHSSQTQQAIRDMYRIREADLQRELSKIESDIRTVERRPVGSLF